MADLEVAVYDSIEAVNRNQWNNLVSQCDLGSVFHRYEWLRAVERGLDHEPRHVVVTKGGNPVGALPNVATSVERPSLSALVDQVPEGRVPEWLRDGTSSVTEVDLDVDLDVLRVGPFADGDGDGDGDALPITQLTSTTPGYGGPIIITDESECLDLLFEGVDAVCDGSVLSHAIKAREPAYVRYGKALAKRGYRPTLLDCRFELNLDYDFEELTDRMDKERRKALRDARANEHEIAIDPLAERVPATYERYTTDMERVGGDAFPRSFFEAIADELGDRALVFAATVEGRDVGRYVYLIDDEQSTVHYFFSGIGDASNFEYNPTELLHAHAMEWGQARGYRYYDFGSTGSTFQDGQFKYKEKYGGRPVPTLRWEKGYAPVLWRAYKMARRGYQRVAY